LNRPHPFKYFMELYVNRLIARSHRKAEKFKDLQARTNRNGENIMRYVIYEDIKSDIDGQQVFIYTVRVRDGVLERLPNTIKPTVTVFTDIPTVYGMIDDRTTIYLGDGKQKVITPFTVWDATRLGRLRWEGQATAMKDFFLFEKQVLPTVMEELKLREM
jgi:hypothetical protein